MNEKTLKEMWHQLRGKIQETWSDLTEEDLDYIAGNKDKLLEKIQKIYGFSKKEAVTEWNKFYKSLSHTISELEDEASSTLKDTGDSIQNFIKKSPFKTLGIAALAGLLVGLRLR